MAIKSFGTNPRTTNSMIQELYEDAGVIFPVTMAVSDGKIQTASYETEWNTGSTTPVETVDAKTGDPVVEYKESYTKQKLTSAQIKKIDAWIKDNLAE